MANRFLGILIGFCLLLTASCVKEPQPIKVTGIALNASSISLTEGETADLKATISPQDAYNQIILWSSSNGSVASVSNGRVTAIKAGSTTITAKSDDGGYTASCAVTVIAKVIEVSSVTLSKSELTLFEGDSETITATVKPDDATDKNVTWTSSSPAVATVEGGKITAVKGGQAMITARAGDKTATCKVTVEKLVSVESVELDKSEIDIIKGESATLVAIVKPDDATDKSVTWSSSNTSIATVSSDGKVTAVEIGKATIIATTNDGFLMASCAVNVIQKPISVTGVRLDKTSLTMTEGDTQTLTATVSPSNAFDKSVTWSSSDDSVATVSSSGVVTAKSAGTATITVTTNDGGKKAGCSVTVKAKTVSVTGVSLNETSLSMTVGDTQTLTATVSPSNATDKTVTWSSSDDSVATVSSSGVVTAKSAGSATITVKTNDGGKTAECYLTVISTEQYVVFEDMKFKAYCLENFDKDKDGEISIAEAKVVTRISVYRQKIKSMKGIEYFSGLTRLECYSNSLTSLDVSKNTLLNVLYCYNNQLTSLDLSKNTSLTQLYCYENRLISLDLSKNTRLIELNCHNNQLTSLVLSKNTRLTYLNCSYNRLTFLDVSGCTALTELDCSSNQLSFLDVSENSALTKLNCYSNPGLKEIWLKPGQSIPFFYYDDGVTIKYVD